MKESKRERTQKVIIQAAKAIVHDQGHDAVTVRHLAKAAGYSYTNLYYYYKDQNALLWALRLHMIEDMITELTESPLPAKNSVDELLYALGSYVDYFYRHPNVFRFFYFCPFTQPEGDDSYHRLEQRFHGIWRLSFSRLIEEGIIQEKNIDAAAKTIIYTLQGMILLSLSSNDVKKKENIQHELAELVNYIFKINT